MNLAFISHEACADHKMGAHHPECPERLHAIQDRMIASGMEMLVTHYDAPEATVEQLARVHDRDYIQGIFDAAPKADDVLAWVDGDTAMNSHSLSAALRSAGAAVLGVDLVMSDKHHAAFCCVRPPGHHAGRRSAGGFCFFNNVAVGAAHALDSTVCSGWRSSTSTSITATAPKTSFRETTGCSSAPASSTPTTPAAGRTRTCPTSATCPLPRLTAGTEYRAAVERAWLPRLDAFAPQLIMISAGFDGHAEDDMAHFKLVEADYAWITRQIHNLAVKHAHERVVSCLEGGYTLSALGRCVSTHVDELIGHA